MIWWQVLLYGTGAILGCAAFIYSVRKTVQGAKHVLDSHLRIVEDRYQAHKDVLLDHDARLIVVENLTSELLKWVHGLPKRRKLYTVNLLHDDDDAARNC